MYGLSKKIAKRDSSIDRQASQTMFAVEDGTGSEDE